jgi:hypothetical protein
MPTFTVHEPPPLKSESVTSPERFVFVRDGFYFWAFVLAPLWLLVRRLWLAFVIFVGEDAELAERRFYAAWTDRAPRASDRPPSAEQTFATPLRRGAPSASDVIGLFPEPGASR